MASRKFIVAVDETEASAYAFTWAIANIFRADDYVLVLNSQNTAPAEALPTVDIAAAGEYAVPVLGPTETEAADASATSQTLVEKYMKHCLQSKIACEGVIVKGDPGAHIVEEATRLAVDAVVVGHHGHGAVKRALLGSISDYVLHNSPASVVIVRTAKGPDVHDPLVNAGICRTIVIAVDESPESVFAFKWAIAHFCTGADKVVILHVENPAVPPTTALGIDQFGMEDVYIPPDTTQKEEVLLRDDSEKLVENFMRYAASQSKVHCEGKVVPGPTEAKVCEELVLLQADAVVVGTHNSSAVKRTFLGSVSDYLAHNSPCPLIVAKNVRVPAVESAEKKDG